MQIDAIPTINDARSNDYFQKTVVVIDVLRATSCMTTALAKRAVGVIPVETVHQAVNLHEDDTLLCGERHCRKIAGFDFGNSPIELMQHDLEGKKMIITTTNGTRIIQKCHKGLHIICASFLNAKKCAEAIMKLNRDTMIVSAGTYDRFSIEDSLCAGLLVEELLSLSSKPIALNDFAKAMHASYLHLKDRIEETLMESTNGKKLRKLGFEEDVKFCSMINKYPIAPILSGQMIVPYEF